MVCLLQDGGIEVVEKYDRYLTKKEVLAEFDNAKEDDLFCVYCYEKLAKTKEGIYYCPNEMCLNDEQGKI